MDYKKTAEEFMIDSFLKTPPFAPPEDMSKGEIGILTYLSFFKNKVLPGDLSSALKISTGRTAIALKSLEKKNMITREKDDYDKRRVIVSVTDKGKAYAKSQKDKALNNLSTMFEFLGEDDTKELIRIYKRIYDAQ